MDIFLYFMGIFLFFLVVFFGIVFVFRKSKKNPKQKKVQSIWRRKYAGELAEICVGRLLMSLGEEYTVFNDFMFHDGKKTVQVDHIVISPYGIFVVETKDYRGTIYGNEKNNNFTKYLNGQRYDFYSPIKQNNGHIYSLKRILGEYKYISLVAFTSGSTLKVESEIFVNYISEIEPYIKSFTQKNIYEGQIAKIVKQLSSIKIVDAEADYEHIKNINIRKKTYEDKVQNLICPRCGGRLIPKSGKYGEFLGC